MSLPRLLRLAPNLSVCEFSLRAVLNQMHYNSMVPLKTVPQQRELWNAVDTISGHTGATQYWVSAQTKYIEKNGFDKWLQAINEEKTSDSNPSTLKKTVDSVTSWVVGKNQTEIARIQAEKSKPSVRLDSAPKVITFQNQVGETVRISSAHVKDIVQSKIIEKVLVPTKKPMESVRPTSNKNNYNRGSVRSHDIKRPVSTQVRR